ncbi:MAG TPA: S53 family peptidase [Candidatus Dormibacteraeota bacterium]
MGARRLVCAALLGTLAAASACGGNPPPATTPAESADAAFASLISRSTDLGPAGADEQLGLSLQLKDESAAAREQAIEAINKPGSPQFMHYVDPQQLSRAYGPDPQTARKARAWLEAQGLQADWPAGSDFISVTAAPADLSRVFNVTPRRYRSRTGVLFTASLRDPQVPPALKPIVTQTTHVSTYFPYRTAAVPEGGFNAQAAANVYGVKDLHDQGYDGSGQTVSIYAIGDGFDQQDLDTYARKNNLPPLKPVLKSGPANAKVQGELMMDIEVVHAIAPGARILIYTDPNSQAFKTAQSLDDFFGRMASDNPGGIWSFSWGGCDLYASDAERQAESAVYQQAAAAGISVLNSTGDSGAYRCMDADWGAPPSDKNVGVELPSSYPLGVTAVGGTRLSVRADGTYYQELAWSEPLVTGGGGGGLSHYYAQPEWQRGPNVSGNQYNPQRRRMVPDVAADADPTTGLAIYLSGSAAQGGGTSQAAPLWAGLTAVINGYLRKKGLKPVGFMNPALYDIAAGHPPYPAFHDVTLGNNLLYPATSGYDLATGLGTPDGYNLARDLEQYQRNGGHI